MFVFFVLFLARYCFNKAVKLNPKLKSSQNYKLNLKQAIHENRYINDYKVNLELRLRKSDKILKSDPSLFLLHERFIGMIKNSNEINFSQEFLKYRNDIMGVLRSSGRDGINLNKYT